MAPPHVPEVSDDEATRDRRGGGNGYADGVALGVYV